MNVSIVWKMSKECHWQHARDRGDATAITSIFLALCENSCSSSPLPFSTENTNWLRRPEVRATNTGIKKCIKNNRRIVRGDWCYKLSVLDVLTTEHSTIWWPQKMYNCINMLIKESYKKAHARFQTFGNTDRSILS